MEGVPIQFRAWISGKVKSPTASTARLKAPAVRRSPILRLLPCNVNRLAAFERVVVLRLRGGGTRHDSHVLRQLLKVFRDLIKFLDSQNSAEQHTVRIIARRFVVVHDADVFRDDLLKSRSLIGFACRFSLVVQIHTRR